MKRFYFLNEKYLNKLEEVDNEVISKKERPYVYIEVAIENNKYLLPLRSKLNHKCGYKSDKYLAIVLDYSKSIPLIDEKLINSSKEYINTKYGKEIIKAKDLDYEVIAKGFKRFLKNKKYMRKNTIYFTNHNNIISYQKSKIDQRTKTKFKLKKKRKR